MRCAQTTVNQMIESNIPIPERKACVTSPIRLALDEMNIGDSCWMPFHNKSIVYNAHTIADRMGMKVATRLTVKEGERGVNVLSVSQFETSMKRSPMNRGKGIQRTRFKVRKFNKRPTQDGASLKDVRDECDALVRTIVALRDEQCVTCPQREGLQVGHLFKRRKELIRWHLLNVAGQCPNCNARHNERPEIYIERFVMRHGEEKYMELRALSQSNRKLTYTDLLSIRDGLRQEAARVAQ